MGEQPIQGTPEFNGLKIMMVMINSWDMKDDNNEILASRESSDNDKLRYIISAPGDHSARQGNYFA